MTVKATRPPSARRAMTVAIWLVNRVLATILEVVAIVRTRISARLTANGLLLGIMAGVGALMLVTGIPRNTSLTTQTHLRRQLGNVATAGRSKGA